MAATARRHHHALAVPLPGQGHVNSLMRFCKRLAEQAGFTITFLHILPSPLLQDMKLRHQQTTELHQQEAAPRTLDIRKAYLELPVHFSETAAVENSEGVLERIMEAAYSLAPQIEQLVLQLLRQDPPITCLISDISMTEPTQCIANKYNLPRIGLHPTCQSMLLLTNYIAEEVLPINEVLKEVESREVPRDNIFKEGLQGLPTVKVGDFLDCPGDSLCMYTQHSKALRETKSQAHAIVVNSFRELEEDAFNVPLGIPLYGVGPLIEPLEKDHNTSFSNEDEACMLWLDSQPTLSVLYISFGSYATLSMLQIEELVAGLVLSQQRFLWGLRRDIVKDVPYETFVEGVLTRSHGKGYVTNWVPQLRVLSHAAIGGFLTHCGWNSTMEALSQGVPMLCFPYFGDQFMNARLIIEKWKVGLGFEEDKETKLVSREEVKKVVLSLLVPQKEGQQLRAKARYLKRACDQSYSTTGDAFMNIQELVASLEKRVL